MHLLELAQHCTSKLHFDLNRLARIPAYLHSTYRFFVIVFLIFFFFFLTQGQIIRALWKNIIRTEIKKNQENWHMTINDKIAVECELLIGYIYLCKHALCTGYHTSYPNFYAETSPAVPCGASYVPCLLHCARVRVLQLPLSVSHLSFHFYSSP